MRYIWFVFLVFSACAGPESIVRELSLRGQLPSGVVADSAIALEYATELAEAAGFPAPNGVTSVKRPDSSNVGITSGKVAVAIGTHKAQGWLTVQVFGDIESPVAAKVETKAREVYKRKYGSEMIRVTRRNLFLGP